MLTKTIKELVCQQVAFRNAQKNHHSAAAVCYPANQLTLHQSLVCSCEHKMTVAVFSVPVFFVIFRETVEVAIIISVLLAFLKQTLDGPNRDVAVYKKLRKQVRPLSLAARTMVS